MRTLALMLGVSALLMLSGAAAARAETGDGRGARAGKGSPTLGKVVARMSGYCERNRSALGGRGREEPWPAFQKRAAKANKRLENLRDLLLDLRQKWQTASGGVGTLIGSYLGALSQQIRSIEQIVTADRTEENTRPYIDEERSDRRARDRLARELGAPSC